jgi:hypothetical protein
MTLLLDYISSEAFLFWNVKLRTLTSGFQSFEKHNGPKTKVSRYQPKPHNLPEEWRLLLHRDGSLMTDFICNNTYIFTQQVEINASDYIK